MSYKLIALDLDDTLLNSQGGISPHTLDVLQQARSRGCYPVIATGRSFAGAKRYYHLLGGNSPIIVLTGSEVLDENGQIIYKMHLENQDALHILRYAKERDLHAQIYVGNDYCFQKYSKYADLYEHFYGFPGKVLPDLYDRDVIDTPKIIYIAEIDTINQIREQIQEQFPHLHLMSSNPHYQIGRAHV